MPSASSTQTAPITPAPRRVDGELIHLPSGQALPLPPRAQPYLVGARHDCDLVVDDPYVSAHHCAVAASESGLSIRDLGSKNGTFVGGARIDHASIRCGARVRIGRTALDVRRAPPRRGFDRLVGESALLVQAVASARQAAPTDCSILILGETGTGKEVLARSIHESSARALGPFVAINCGAIPRELVASELFGHVRGSFTGASSDREGVFARADGGTLFLDELAELPAEHQVHLLRVLEEGAITPVGAARAVQVDVRVVAATNATDIDSRRSPLRTDLYHRLATLVVDLPPLRQRPSDIPILVRHFMADLEPRYGSRLIDADTLCALQRLPWPGNVRELRQAVHRATALCASELTLDGLVPPRMRMGMLRAEDGAAAAALLPIDSAVRDLMAAAYHRHGTIRAAAASLGMPKSTFADRARRYGLIKHKD